METAPGKDKGASKGAPVASPSGLSKPAVPAIAPNRTARSDEAVVQAIAAEREVLSNATKQLLDSHLMANTAHDRNQRCFRQTQMFKPVTLTFARLRANSKAFLTLQGDQEAIWSEGGGGERLVGVCLSSRVDPLLYLSNFLVNAREVYVQTYKDMQEVRISLYLRTEQSSVRGRVDLPPDASVTLQSAQDRSTVIGLSSFAIELG
ncbi:hypothetical protein NRY95_11055 [Xanthomonas campestris pv. phormiicola]|nr:hypothetical protein [Xanthomonas campestris pv. phormiicola]UYC18446.1 hypothetical protein NRY95_11055 [Xanthomonas campestris pv. phormiicola]